MYRIETCIHDFGSVFVHSTHGTFLVLIKLIAYCHFDERANFMIILEIRIFVIFQVINLIKVCIFWLLLSFILYF